jgi:hypothetical protein
MRVAVVMPAQSHCCAIAGTIVAGRFGEQWDGGCGGPHGVSSVL